MAETHWPTIIKFEDALDEKKPLNHRACNLLTTFVETLFQKGLIDRYILHNICESGYANKRETWEALHEFAERNEKAIFRAYNEA